MLWYCSGGSYVFVGKPMHDLFEQIRLREPFTWRTTIYDAMLHRDLWYGADN